MIFADFCTIYFQNWTYLTLFKIRYNLTLIIKFISFSHDYVFSDPRMRKRLIIASSSTISHAPNANRSEKVLLLDGLEETQFSQVETKFSSMASIKMKKVTKNGEYWNCYIKMSLALDHRRNRSIVDDNVSRIVHTVQHYILDILPYC